jgi:hypothetical protein
MSWIQPPGYVHAMMTAALGVARNGLAVTTSYDDSSSPAWLSSSAQLSDDRTTLIIQLVNTNTAGQPTNVTLTVTPDFSPSGEVIVTTLQDPAADPGAGVPPNPDAGNTPANPTYISPVTTSTFWPRGSSSLTVALPAYSFTILRVFSST